MKNLTPSLYVLEIANTTIAQIQINVTATVDPLGNFAESSEADNTVSIVD